MKNWHLAPSTRRHLAARIREYESDLADQHTEEVQRMIRLVLKELRRAQRHLLDESKQAAGK